METTFSLRPPLLCLLVLLALCGGCGLFQKQPPPDFSGTSPQARKVVQTAYTQMGKKYRLGGASPQKGFDCSGLIWWSYKRHGIKVPRITSDQARAGRAVPQKAARAGDIVVFRTGSSPRGLHTGLYSGNGTFIHSPRKGERVRMESLEVPYWKKKLISVRRIVR